MEWIAEDLRGLAVPIGDLAVDPQNARKHGETIRRIFHAGASKMSATSPTVRELD